MPEDEAGPERSFRDRAQGIAGHDEEAVQPPAKDVHFQWNVPRGQVPFIPLWMALLFFGGIAVAVILAVL